MAFKKWVFATDVHGNLQDPEANKAFFKFMADWKPHHRIMGGDLFDFAALRKKADADEKRLSIRLDRDMGMEWLKKFKPTAFLDGNHDFRIYQLAEANNGPMSDFAVDCIHSFEKDLKKLGCKVHLPYHKRQGIYELGKLKMAHGFCHGVNASRRMAAAYGAILFGHGHGIQHHSVEALENRMGRMVGCLCQLDLPYNYATMATLVHRHGWAYGLINEETGLYYCFQAECIDGTYVLPIEFLKL